MIHPFAAVSCRLPEIRPYDRCSIAHSDGQTVSAGEPFRADIEDSLQRIAHLCDAHGVRGDIGSAPERGKGVAAVQHVSAENAE